MWRKKQKAPTAKELIQKYPGWRVEISDAALQGITNLGRSISKAYGRIIGRRDYSKQPYFNEGYDDNYVVIWFEDEELRKYVWSLDQYPLALCVNRDNLEEPHTGWLVHPTHIKPLEPPKPVKKYDVRPYPGKCKVCKSPARKICGVTYCSNLRCKTKYTHPKFPTPKVRILSCPMCGSKRLTARYLPMRTLKSKLTIGKPSIVMRNESKNTWMLYCDKKHKWEHDLKVNDVLLQSQAKPGLRDSIYTEKGWVEY